MERTLDIGRSSLVSSASNDLKVFTATATVPPRFEIIKTVLLSIADSLSPYRNGHGGTLFSLVERTVNLSMNFLQLAKMARSTPQIIIDDFYCMLQDVKAFIRTGNRRKPYPTSKAPVALKRARDAECRILGQRLITTFDGLRAALSAHIELENSALAPSSQGRTIATSSLFQDAHNFTLNGSQFYSAPGGYINVIVGGREHFEGTIYPHNIPINPTENLMHFQTTGQTGLSNSILYEELELEKEIHKAGEYRLHRGRARGRAVVVKVFQGPRAKQLCSNTAEFNQNLNIMHPNILRMIADPNHGPSFLVFDGDSHGTVESKLALTLSDSIEETCILGANTVIACSLGLDYLQDVGLPFSIMGPDDFVLMASQDGRIVINFDVDTTWDAGTSARHDGAVYPVATDKTKKVIEVCHELIQKTFYAICKEHYQNQRFYDDDESDGALVGDDSGFIGQEDEAGLSGADSDSSEDPVVLTRPIGRSQASLRRSKGHRRELVWRSQALNSASLEEIGRTYQTSLSRFRFEITRNHRRGHSVTQTNHRCPGYKRTEIILTPDIKKSGIVSHAFPVPNEICSVCQEKVEKAEAFDCSCGLPNKNELLPTVKCSRCSLWQHQGCMPKIPSYFCRRCLDNDINGGIQARLNSVAIPTYQNNTASHTSQDPRLFVNDSGCVIPLATRTFDYLGVAAPFIRMRRKESAIRKQSRTVISSGEPRTQPGVAEACIGNVKLSVEYIDYFVCVGGVNVSTLLRATRSVLMEHIEPLGANGIINESWMCTISESARKSGHNRSYKVEVRYTGDAVKSSAQDLRRPVALDKAKGVPGLMTVVERRGDD